MPLERVAELVREYDASGLTQAEFARRAGTASSVETDFRSALRRGKAHRHAQEQPQIQRVQKFGLLDVHRARQQRGCPLAQQGLGRLDHGADLVERLGEQQHSGVVAPHAATGRRPPQNARRLGVVGQQSGSGTGRADPRRRRGRKLFARCDHLTIARGLPFFRSRRAGSKMGPPGPPPESGRSRWSSLRFILRDDGANAGFEFLEQRAQGLGRQFHLQDLCDLLAQTLAVGERVLAVTMVVRNGDQYERASLVPVITRRQGPSGGRPPDAYTTPPRGHVLDVNCPVGVLQKRKQAQGIPAPVATEDLAESC